MAEGLLLEHVRAGYGQAVVLHDLSLSLAPPASMAAASAWTGWPCTSWLCTSARGLA